MLRIGLTGGIASGKSAAADLFLARGVTIIDTDLVARDVVEPGQPGLDAIADRFGTEFLTDEGRLDRDKLRKYVFSDPDARLQLEAILHPLIEAKAFAQADQSPGPYQIIVIPLLQETGFGARVDRVLVVDCPENIQLERLMNRDNETETSARAILNAQASRNERLAVADDVLSNTGTMAELDDAVEELHQKYLQLAADQTPG